MSTTAIPKTAPRTACYVRDCVTFELLAPSDPQQPTVRREWRMLANTGKVMQRWWGDLVLDLDGAKFSQRLALLLDHVPEQRLGYSTKVERTSRGIEASGRMLKNELSAQVLSESGEGFPFQASLMAVPTRVQELDQGEEAQVNGQTVTGPCVIFREWKMRELTLTVLGADDETTTEAFAEVGEVSFTMTKTERQPDVPATTAAAPVSAPQVAPPQAQTFTAEELTAKEQAAEARGREAGIAAERARVNAILKEGSGVQIKLLGELVEKGTSDADAVRALLADARTRLTPPAQDPAALGNATTTETKPSQPEGEPKWRADFAASAELRAEFKTVEIYLSWKRNEKAFRRGNLRADY